MDISWITKVILKNCQKIGKMSRLTVKNGIFTKFQRFSFFYSTRSSQPKYHIPRLYKEKNRIKPLKSVKIQISKKKVFFLMSQGSLSPKNRSKGVTCSSFTDRRTHRVTTEGTLSGFQDFSFNVSSRIGPINDHILHI